MSLQLRDVTIDTLHNIVQVCRELPEDERSLWEILSGVPYVAEDVAMMLFNSRGHSWIGHDGDQPVAAAGFIRQRPGVYRTWMVATPRAWSSYGRELTTITRDGIRTILDQGVAHRIETITLADRELARHWYKKIGLQHESTHPGYGINGETAVTYVALRGAETV